MKMPTVSQPSRSYKRPLYGTGLMQGVRELEVKVTERNNEGKQENAHIVKNTWLLKKAAETHDQKGWHGGQDHVELQCDQ